jgi:hypothetical protein
MRLGRPIVLLALTLLAGQANAQATSSTTTAAAATTSTTQQTTSTPTTTASATQTSQQSTTQLPSVTTTNTASTSTLPSITSNTGLPNLTTALPKLTQNTANIPTYQVVIPNVANNPFLQKSSYPDGTVFIIVGSCLAGLALMLVGWRAAYIWCLHRQSKQHKKQFEYSEMAESRPYSAINPNRPSPNVSSARDISLDFLRPGDRKSTSSFTGRPATGRPSTSAMRPVSTAGDPRNTSSVQFYSPSAHPGGTTAAALGTAPGDRNSAYLPAGYYLRDASSGNTSTAVSSTTATSPRQNYATPPASSYLLTDPTAPIPRLSRSGTQTSLSTAGGLGVRPVTAAPAAGYYGPTPTRPVSTGYPSPGLGSRRGVASSQGDSTYAGDRRSKPSQVLDELLGGV